MTMRVDTVMVSTAGISMLVKNKTLAYWAIYLILAVITALCLVLLRKLFGLWKEEKENVQ